MKKRKVQKTNAVRLLEKQKRSFKLYEYPWSEDHLGAEDVSQIINKPQELVYKTLVIRGDRTGIIVACLSADSELDLKAVAKISGNKKVELLPLKDLEKTTGYIRGGCSPIGMKKQFPTYLSKRASALERIIVSAGKRGLQVELDPNDLKKAAAAEFADIEL